MDPGQDLLLAALSESGICPNDIGLFDVDSQDVTQPSTTEQVQVSLIVDIDIHNLWYTLMCSYIYPFSSPSPSVPWMLEGERRQLKLRLRLQLL